METTYKIKNGPGKFELSTALFGRDCKHNHVDFKVNDPGPGKPFLIETTKVTTVTRIASHRFKVTGMCMLPEDKDAGRPIRGFKATFDTMKRDGSLEVYSVNLIS